MIRALTWCLATLLAAPALAAEPPPLAVLFVGNSFTYTRPPALQYNLDGVTDLNYENFLANPEGADPALPQPWGGVPAIFEVLARQAGIAVDVKHSLRGGATLRGHFLNTNPAGWDLRANIAKQPWDLVVLQGNSTEALDVAGGNRAQFIAYVDKLSDWIHVGAAEQYRESALYPGGSNALRTIPANPSARADTRVFLYQTWARPDLVDPDGTPYAGQTLEAMTADLREAYAAAAAINGRIAGVAPVGDAFLHAVQTGVALRDPYRPTPDGVDLWWHEDQFHPGVHGSYLSALVMFGTLTGVDPRSFGVHEQAAADLGIDGSTANRLQRVAGETLAASALPLRRLPCLRAVAAAQGVACAAEGAR
jgi:hypothetical protein